VKLRGGQNLEFTRYIICARFIERETQMCKDEKLHPS